MNRLTTNTKKAYGLFFLTLTTLLFLLIFIPMRRQLEYQVTENFSLLAESKQQTIATLVNNCMSSANSLSSRTVIKEYINQYKSDQMDWKTLQILTDSKYNDGLRVIPDLIFAIRYVDDHPLVTTSQSRQYFEHYMNLFNRTAQTEYVFESSSEDVKIIVCSPILSNDQLLGHDIIAVDISKHLEWMSQNGFIVNIIDTYVDTPESIVPNKVYTRHRVGKMMLTFIALPINERYLFGIGKPTSEVYESLNRISLLSIVGLMLGLVLVFIILQISIVKMANSIISEIGNSRDTYMRYANYDALTGSYTRNYLDNWINSFQRDGNDRSFIVGMIDVDYFKNINDTFGHGVGDQVLIFIAKTLMTLMDRYGFVVRLGGDEFIIVCENDDPARTFDIFNSINQQINETNPFDFNISVSCGVKKADDIDALYSAIKIADENMYQNKKQNKL
ncbi:GGDEF domain-containing protein [Oscillospiraceae bacterium LTW-04]|nr:GGDEF domain-containing protein [Oscillospiraceae bacterium MB24-C1]